MKKAVLRDEYIAPSRAELKAFIEKEFNGKEADERKANISIENAKSGRYEARDYEYLDGSVIHLEAKEAIKRDEIKGHLFNSNINSADKCVKYEGKIYERDEKLSFVSNDKYIEIVVPEFVRDYVLVVDYVGICHQNLMAMAKAGIMPVMVGARREIWDVNNNDDGFKGQSSRNYNHEMINEMVERGIKWSKLMYDGVDASRAFAKSWVNNNKISNVKIFEIGVYDDDKKCVIDSSMFYFRKGKLFELSPEAIENRYDLSNIYEVENDFALSRRNSDVFIRRSKNIRGNKIIENVKDKVIEEEKVAVRNNSDGCIEEVKVDSEEVVEIKEFKRCNLMNIVIEDLDIMKRNDDELVRCELEFKDEGRLSLNGGNYLSSSAGKYGELKAEIEKGSKVPMDKNSKVVYEASGLNGAIRVGKFNKENKAYDYIKANRKEGRNAFSKLVINHRERHPVISERLVKYVKVGDKLVVIYNG